MRLRNWFLVFLVVVSIWFLYAERHLLAPLILAAIFAYIFNPVINFASKKLKIPRTISILIVYSVLLTIIIVLGSILIRRISEESLAFSRALNNVIDTARFQVYVLPDWLRPTANDFLLSLRKSSFSNLIKDTQVIPVFSQIVSRIISFFIFLFSAFYLLKDGESGVKKLVSYIPVKYREDVEKLFQKINKVLGGYLRQQMLLVVIMSVMIYIALSILGVKFALSIAIFSGFAEIVPVIGPITAGAIATLDVLLTGSSSFGFIPIQTALSVILVYFILRQVEDYFIVPHVLKRVTKLPPIFIFLAVIAGGHIAGILGLVLAIPVAAIIRILLKFSFEKLFLNVKS